MVSPDPMVLLDDDDDGRICVIFTYLSVSFMMVRHALPGGGGPPVGHTAGFMDSSHDIFFVLDRSFIDMHLDHIHKGFD